jgi:hypothetical protein
MILENSYIETNEQYSRGLAIDEYKGSYSLVEARRGTDGKLYSKWGYPEHNRQPIEKPIPWKITLGDDGDSALDTLIRLVKFMRDGDMDSEAPF